MKIGIKLTISAVALCLFLISCNEATSKKSNVEKVAELPVQEIITVIDVTTFEEATTIGDVQLIDVRRDNEWESGHLRNAKHFEMNNPDWNSQIETLDKDKPVYVYCAKGGRSARSAKQLEEAGFKEIYDLEGGITNWKAAGKSIE